MGTVDNSNRLPIGEELFRYAQNPKIKPPDSNMQRDMLSKKKSNASNPIEVGNEGSLVNQVKHVTPERPHLAHADDAE